MWMSMRMQNLGMDMGMRRGCLHLAKRQVGAMDTDMDMDTRRREKAAVRRFGIQIISDGGISMAILDLGRH
jgi:hypothetical protein